MENLTTFEEFSFFRKKELTPDEEYRRQSKEAERNRPRNPDTKYSKFWGIYDDGMEEEEEEEEEQIEYDTP